MPIFSAELEGRDKIGTQNMKWLRTEDVLNGLWRLKSVKITKANNIKFGATKNDNLCIRGILKEGETIEYLMADEEGNEKTFNTKSVTFYIAIRKANLSEEDRFEVIREGTGASTRYHINKVIRKEDVPDVFKSDKQLAEEKEEKEEEILSASQEAEIK